jgi:hypothetical protein
MITPKKLGIGHQIRIIAPSRNLSIVSAENKKYADDFF